jgi:SNF2 family DNA or RNA helicase
VSVPDTQLSKYDESTKIKRLLEHLKKMRETDPTAKAVVFSQWTSMLDLVGESLQRHNFKTARYDGSMTMSQRGSVLADFTDNPDTTVLLMSLKAGGVGINLVVANYTFLLDLWWNPAVEG